MKLGLVPVFVTTLGLGVAWPVGRVALDGTVPGLVPGKQKFVICCARRNGFSAIPMVLGSRFNTADDSLHTLPFLQSASALHLWGTQYLILIKPRFGPMHVYVLSHPLSSLHFLIWLMSNWPDVTASSAKNTRTHVWPRILERRTNRVSQPNGSAWIGIGKHRGQVRPEHNEHREAQGRG